MMLLQQAHDLLAARLPDIRLVGEGSRLVQRVHTDTRTLQAGDLFVALKGERFDAHEFLPQAKAAGAAAVMAAHGVDTCGLSGIALPSGSNTTHALGELAGAWRAQFDLPLIAVTGSNGKTTVTQMIAAILDAWHSDAALATQGNFNNDVGVPLTLLRLRPKHRVAVVELGMNHPGEIERLAAITQPTVALVNNAQREHQEFMSTVEAVARENASVFTALPADGVAVFPATDAFADLWRHLAVAGGPHRRCLSFSLNVQVKSDVCGTAQWGGDGWSLSITTPAGLVKTQLRMAGQHNALNALAACACAVAVGVPLRSIEQGLASFEPIKGRSRWLKRSVAGRPLDVVDDAYNANPDSVRAAIDVLASMPAPRWLVLGDMGEVGEQGPAFHREIGAYARQRKIDTLWTTGALSLYAANSFGMAQQFDSVDELIKALPQGLTDLAPSSVLVKASKFMQFPKVVDALLASTAEPDAPSSKPSPEAAKC